MSEAQIDALLGELGGGIAPPSEVETDSKIDDLLADLGSKYNAPAASAPAGGTTTANSGELSEAEAMLASLGITEGGSSSGSAAPKAPIAVSVPVASPAQPALLNPAAMGTVKVAVDTAAAPAAEPVFKDRNDEIVSALSTVNALVKGMASGELKELSTLLNEGGERTQLPDYLDPNAPALSDKEFADMGELLDFAEPEELKGTPAAAPGAPKEAPAVKQQAEDAFDNLDALLEGTNISADVRAEQEDVFAGLDDIAGKDLADW